MMGQCKRCVSDFNFIAAAPQTVQAGVSVISSSAKQTSEEAELLMSDSVCGCVKRYLARSCMRI